MKRTSGWTYAKAGVSIDAGNELVRRIRKIVASDPRARRAIGGFSGLYPLPGSSGLLLSGCCDGVGTKLKLAFLSGIHDTVGIDLVAMNVNDLICQGARPLFFLDYFGCGKLDVDVAESVLRGIYKGCREAGCALLGGETAEMPGFYPEGEYDLAGFAVGVARRKDLLDPGRVRPGDRLLGLPSSGFHSNGFSLVRKIFPEKVLKARAREFLVPTRIYVQPILSLLKRFPGAVHGIAHITGGGWIDNPPRMLPPGLGIRFLRDSWPVPGIFKETQERGRVSSKEMYRTFNMGIGLMLAVDPKKAERVRRFLGAHPIGEVRESAQEVAFE